MINILHLVTFRVFVLLAKIPSVVLYVHAEISPKPLSIGTGINHRLLDFGYNIYAQLYVDVTVIKTIGPLWGLGKSNLGEKCQAKHYIDYAA